MPRKRTPKAASGIDSAPSREEAAASVAALWHAHFADGELRPDFRESLALLPGYIDSYFALEQVEVTMQAAGPEGAEIVKFYLPQNTAGMSGGFFYTSESGGDQSAHGANPLKPRILLLASGKPGYAVVPGVVTWEGPDLPPATAQSAAGNVSVATDGSAAAYEGSRGGPVASPPSPPAPNGSMKMSEVPPSSDPFDAPPPAKFIAAPMLWTVIGVAALATAGGFGVNLARGLGEQAQLANFAIVSMLGVAVIGLSSLLRATALAVRRVATIPWTVKRVARAGGSLAEALRHGNEVAEEERGRVGSGASALANTQILLGMVWTAGYLASQAGIFVATAEGLEAGQASDLGSSVASLLSVGPKAFLATAAAVSTSLIVGFIGARQVDVVRGNAPNEVAMIASWTDGNREWAQGERERTVARDQAILDAALSNQSVNRLNDALASAAATFSGLAGTVKDFNETAARIASAQNALESLAEAIRLSDSRANSVAVGLQELAEEVRNNSAGLLAVSKEFGAELSRSSQSEGARLVGETVAQTMSAMRPEFSKLAQDLHSEMENSAESLRNRAANEFSGQIAEVRRDLTDLDEVVRQLRGHLGGLVNEVRTGAQSMGANVAVLSETMKTVGGSLDPQGRTFPALQAMEKTRRELEQTVAQLAQAGTQLASGMTAVRRNAEIIGRMKEIAGAGGGSRARD